MWPTRYIHKNHGRPVIRHHLKTLTTLSLIQVEVREDKEQVVKLQDIIDILVAAGYFRARIKGLAPFDKIVGGMTWCIRHCNVDVDVDLLFQENSTIGQKMYVINCLQFNCNYV